jgi:hypothetical protein
VRHGLRLLLRPASQGLQQPCHVFANIDQITGAVENDDR